MEYIANQLKKARQYTGLTQSELSRGLCSRQYVAKVEAGLVVPTANMFLAFCERLRYPVDDVLDKYIEIQTDKHELMELAILLSAQGQLRRGFKVVNERILHSSSRDELIYLWAQMLDAAGHVLAGLSLYENVISTLTGERLTDALFRAAKCARTAGKIVTAHRLYAEALTHASATRSCSSSLKSRILLNLANVEYALGSYTSATGHYSEARLLARHSRDVEMQVSALLGVSACLLGLGQFPEADVLLSECEILCDALGDASLLPRIYNNQAIARSGLGRKDEAVRLLTKSVDLDRELGLLANIVYSLNELTQIHLELDQLEQASRCNEESLGLLCEVNDFRERALAYELAARTRLRKCDCESALECLQKALDSLGPIAGARKGMLLCLAAETSLTLGRIGDATRYCRDASKLFEVLEKEDVKK